MRKLAWAGRTTARSASGYKTMTKKEIISKLEKLGAKFNPKDKKEKLERKLNRLLKKKEKLEATKTATIDDSGTKQQYEEVLFYLSGGKKRILKVEDAPNLNAKRIYLIDGTVELCTPEDYEKRVITEKRPKK